MKHSATSLEKFQNCSLLWYHRYVDHWKEPTDEGATFGTVLHAAAAETLSEGGAHPNQDWKTRYLLENVLEPSHELIQLTEMYYENWESHQIFDGRKPILVEQMYEAILPEYGTLTGKIDAMWWSEELGFYIVDHKFVKDSEKQKSNQQMAMYSLLEPKATHFFYEKVGLDDYKVQETHNLTPALQKIKKTIQCISEGVFVPNPQAWFIPYCPFLDKCGKCLKGDSQ